MQLIFQAPQRKKSGRIEKSFRLCEALNDSSHQCRLLQSKRTKGATSGLLVELRPDILLAKFNRLMQSFVCGAKTVQTLGFLFHVRRDLFVHETNFGGTTQLIITLV